MTDKTNAQRDAWDNEARAELTVEFHDFGYSTRHGKVDPAGWVEVFRDGVKVGDVTVYKALNSEGVIETGYIRLQEPYHFDKELHAEGKYQPRWGLFLMEKVFDQFPDKEIRESDSENDTPGKPFVIRVRGEYGLPYHEDFCLLNGSQECICVVGCLRTSAS